MNTIHIRYKPLTRAASEYTLLAEQHPEVMLRGKPSINYQSHGVFSAEIKKLLIVFNKDTRSLAPLLGKVINTSLWQDIIAVIASIGLSLCCVAPLVLLI